MQQEKERKAREEAERNGQHEPEPESSESSDEEEVDEEELKQANADVDAIVNTPRKLIVTEIDFQRIVHEEGGPIEMPEYTAMKNRLK